MNKKIGSLLLSSALAMGALSARGQTAASPASPPAAAPSATAPAAPPAPTASWTLTPTFASQYMFRGVRLGGPSFEPSLEFDYDTIALGVWANFPLSDKVVGQSDPEYDIYGSYTIAMSDSFSVVPGFTWYNYPRAPSALGFYKATFEPNVAFNYTVGGVKLTPKFYYDLVLHGPTVELSASWALPLKSLGTELDFLGTIGTYRWTSAADNTSPDLRNYGNYYLVGVSAPYAINSSSKITVGFAYTQGSDNYFKQSGSPKFENGAAVGRGVVTVSYAFTF